VIEAQIALGFDAILRDNWLNERAREKYERDTRGC
jgi:hypothetical protein